MYKTEGFPITVIEIIFELQVLQCEHLYKLEKRCKWLFFELAYILQEC